MNRCLPPILLLYKRFLLCGLVTMQKLCIYINSFVETVITITIAVNRKTERNFIAKHVLCVDMTCSCFYIQKLLQKLYKTFTLELWLSFNWNLIIHTHCLTMFISSIDINQMASSRRCVNDPDNFSYTCGEFTPKANRKLISYF